MENIKKNSNIAYSKNITAGFNALEKVRAKRRRRILSQSLASQQPEQSIFTSYVLKLTTEAWFFLLNWIAKDWIIAILILVLITFLKFNNTHRYMHNLKLYGMVNLYYATTSHHNPVLVGEISISFMYCAQISFNIFMIFIFIPLFVTCIVI